MNLVAKIFCLLQEALRFAHGIAELVDSKIDTTTFQIIGPSQCCLWYGNYATMAPVWFHRHRCRRKSPGCFAIFCSQFARQQESSPMSRLCLWFCLQWSLAIYRHSLVGIEPSFVNSLVDVESCLFYIDPWQFRVIENELVADDECSLVFWECGLESSVAIQLHFLLVQDGSDRVLSPVNSWCLEGSLLVKIEIFQSPGTVIPPGDVAPTETGISFSFHSVNGGKDVVPNPVEILFLQPGRRWQQRCLEDTGLVDFGIVVESHTWPFLDDDLSLF